MSKSLLMIGNYLSAARHTRSVGEELRQHLEQSGWSVLAASGQTNRLLRLADMLTTTIFHAHEYRVALVEVYSGAAFLWAEVVCAALKWLNKPYVLALHGGNLPAFSRLHSRRVRQLLAGAQAVSVPSRYLQESIQPYRDDLMLIPNAVDPSCYSFRQRVSPEPNLIWLRAFHHIYNPQLAVETLHFIHGMFPAASLIMVGSDKGDGSFQETKRRALDLGVSNMIEYSGGVRKTEVPAWLNRGEIFLNTTNIDNTPISVIEAMACGLCVVSTNVGGLPYLLDDGEDALLVPPDDPAAMADAIRRILCEPGLAQKLSSNGRSKAEQLDWAVVLPQWEKILHELV